MASRRKGILYKIVTQEYNDIGNNEEKWNMYSGYSSDAVDLYTISNLAEKRIEPPPTKGDAAIRRLSAKNS